MFLLLKTKAMKISVIVARYLFEYTKKEQRPAFRYRIKKENTKEPVRFVTLVTPYAKEIHGIKIELMKNQMLELPYVSF